MYRTRERWIHNFAIGVLASLAAAFLWSLARCEGPKQFRFEVEYQSSDGSPPSPRASP
jgi:hypothetical protein